MALISRLLRRPARRVRSHSVGTRADNQIVRQATCGDLALGRRPRLLVQSARQIIQGQEWRSVSCPVDMRQRLIVLSQVTRSSCYWGKQRIARTKKCEFVCTRYDDNMPIDISISSISYNSCFRQFCSLSHTCSATLFVLLPLQVVPCRFLQHRQSACHSVPSFGELTSQTQLSSASIHRLPQSRSSSSPAWRSTNLMSDVLAGVINPSATASSI